MAPEPAHRRAPEPRPKSRNWLHRFDNKRVPYILLVDPVAVEELPRAVVIADYPADRVAALGDPADREDLGPGAFLRVRPRREFVQVGPDAGFVVLWRHPQRRLIGPAVVPAALLPGEEPVPIRPYQLHDRQWRSLIEVERRSEQPRIPGGLHGAYRQREAAKHPFDRPVEP